MVCRKHTYSAYMNVAFHWLIPSPHNTVTVQQTYRTQVTSLESLCASVTSVFVSIDRVSSALAQARDPTLDVLVSAIAGTWWRAARRRREAVEVDRESMSALICRVLCALQEQGEFMCDSTVPVLVLS